MLVKCITTIKYNKYSHRCRNVWNIGGAGCNSPVIGRFLMLVEPREWGRRQFLTGGKEDYPEQIEYVEGYDESSLFVQEVYSTLYA